jgi:O-antigen/teichoic acid export membrane protein
MYQLSILLIGRMHGSNHAAIFAVIQQTYTMALGLVVMIAQPLWPALSDAKARHDRKWAMDAYRKVLLFAMIYSFVFFLVMIVAGHEIFNIWYHHKISISPSISFFVGLYFVFAVWEYVHYNILIGMNKLVIPAVMMVARSILMLAIAPFMINKLGDVGLSISLCIAQAALTAWAFPILVKKALALENFTDVQHTLTKTSS